MAGQTRFRKIQVGKQSVIGTAVPATRVLPYRGLILYDPKRTDPDVDVGSLDPVLPPYMLAPETTMAGATGPLAFDDLAVRASAGIKGGVSPTGPTGTTAYTWTFQAASLTADAFDFYSVQTGDDTADASGDGTLGYGGVIDTFSQAMAEDLGPWTVTDDWVFANATYGNRTGSLSVASAPAWVFGADTAFYLDSAAGSIGITALASAVRGASIRISNNLDQKRFADGSNVRFALQSYGRAARTIEFTVTAEKTAAVIAEATTLDDTPTPNRYWKVLTASTELAGTATPYKSEFYLPCRLVSVADGAIGGNTNLTLTYHGFYDSTLLYALKLIVVNKLATLP
jgi:hypothetical protein